MLLIILPLVASILSKPSRIIIGCVPTICEWTASSSSTLALTFGTSRYSPWSLLAIKHLVMSLTLLGSRILVQVAISLS